ncbi:hypothetical protein GCM10011487_00610 [Steroidobacter agaridevorans]|uniref:DUF748 domain-containing protein n=1 Tax=Steroidobacter agaridevorans TaxID=2695856 RepID=A0A829Y4U6_9GAMM|nr:DUF748 domain-containing protein [Steroidobacter agaridevorans]GFE78061.1 hypothetical protein GCM10011487_00610 [Steroidobacter agaridevorans]
MRRREKWLIAVAIVVVLAVAIRAALPTLIRDRVNDQLQALEDYDGHIDDVDLSLIRGAYRIDNIQIVKTGSGQPVPFFSSDRIDFSVEWRSLLHGSLVSEAEFFNPNVNFVKAENEQQSQTGKGVNWADRFEQLFPFKFNTVRVHNGTVTFTAPGISTRDAIKATRLEGELTNLTNVVDSGKETFAGFRADAQVLDGGSVEVSGSVDPLEAKPTFDVNLQLRNVKLPQVNPWLRQYIKADAEAGDFELYLELAAADGKFKGYAKPILEHVNIYSSEEPEENVLKRIWEGLVDFAANVLENDEKEQVAARIPFTGTIDNPKTSILETIVSVLHNAFVSAFARSLEGSISVRAVRDNLKDIGEPAADKDQKNGKDKKSDAKKEPDKKGDKKRTEEPDFGPKRNT